MLKCVADWSSSVNEGRLMELDGELVLAKVMVWCQAGCEKL